MDGDFVSRPYDRYRVRGVQLDRVDAERIFHVISDDRGLHLVDSCDACFELRITPENLAALGQELIDLAKRTALASRDSPTPNP